MVQLKACLLLLLLFTDTPLALLSDPCNGHMDLSQEPTGHLSFKPKQRTDQTSRTSLMVCTRTLVIPEQHTALLKLEWLETGSNMSLVCVWNTKEWTLDVGDTALLSGCDQNKATLTWSGAGHSSDAFQLFYYVQVGLTAIIRPFDREHSRFTFQEDKKSSTETSPISHSHPNITSNPASTIKHGPLSESADPSGNPELIQSTAPPRASGNTDRKTFLFPGEKWHNGPDTSGAMQRTDSPGTLDDFNTQHSIERSKFQTITNEAESNSEMFISTGLYTTSHTLDNQSLPMSSKELLDNGSTVLQQNPLATAENKILDFTENWQSIGEPVTKSPKTQREELIEGSSSHFESLHSTSSSSVKNLTIGSTERPHIITKSEFQDVTLSMQNISQTESDRNTTMNFHLLKSTQESTENTQNIQKASVGTSSMSLVPHLDTDKGLVTAHTSLASTLSSTTGFELGVSGKEEAKTTENHDLLTTHSYFGDHTTSTELESFPAEAMSTLSQGTLANQRNTVLSNGKSATGLPTLSLNTISVQQTINSTVVNKEILSQNETFTYTTSRMDTASTKVQVTQNPHQLSVSTSKYQIPPSSTIASQRDENIKAPTSGLQHMTSWTPEPAKRVTTYTRPYFSSVPIVGTTAKQKAKFYIVPDEPAIIRVDSIELLLQILVEESHSTMTEGLEEDTALWLKPYLQRAPGFREVLRVWSSGAAVQCLLEFDTRAALQWLPQSGASSLLDRTGLKQAVHEGQSFRSARITNITLGGVQEACGWLLQCPSGFTCVFDSHTSNFSCTSVCHSDYCQHHGLCTHHPAQPPLCRCIVGQDFWFMGPRCELWMTRARLALSCLGVLLLLLGLVAGTAGMVVRRYRALLVQAKVEQTRSSYCRFNHFDELSGRFWLHSWPGSADSLDNPAFTRSTEILHLRALERPCCYHDDSLSLPSTCPSPGNHIRTIYPHRSQYAWGGSDVSLADGVLDSGKASDLSVCSWPLEPIQWSPFPLLQQLSRQQAPVVRVPRLRSYCDGMELLDMNKSWTA